MTDGRSRFQSTRSPTSHDNAAQPCAGANPGWSSQFRFAVHVFFPRVPELWTLGIQTIMTHVSSRQVCFIALLSVVFATSLIHHVNHYRSRRWESLAPAFYVALGGLLLMSLIFHKRNSTLSRIGFAAVVIAWLWSYNMPALMQ